MTSDDPTVLHGVHDEVTYLVCEVATTPDPVETSERSWTRRGVGTAEESLHLAHPGATFTLCGEPVGRVGPVLASEMRRSQRDLCALCLEQKERHDVRDLDPQG